MRDFSLSLFQSIIFSCMKIVTIFVLLLLSVPPTSHESWLQVYHLDMSCILTHLLNFHTLASYPRIKTSHVSMNLGYFGYLTLGTGT